MAKTVVGLFDDFNDAQAVVQDLVNAGFRREDISLAANQAASGRTAGDVDGDGMDTADAAGLGATTGTVVGGTVGLLVGLGALLIPGVGPILAAGPLAVFLGSTALGAGVGAAAGGLIGGLTHLGVPQEHAEYYAEGVRRGGTLVTVSAPDAQAEQAVEIMNGANAVDIEERGAAYRTGGYTGYTESAPAYTPEEIDRERDTYRTAPAASGSGEQVIPLVEEELAVGKRQVQRGGARIHTTVTETPVSEQVTLRDETVTVSRRPVDRAANDTDMAFKDDTLEVTETTEVPVVSKEARVVEEVVVGKKASEHTETVSDTVRRTEVDVEDIAP